MNNFKKTVRTILLFFLFVIIFSIVIMEAYFSGENYLYQDAKERKELSGTIDFLICGSSHSMRSLEPEVLDEELNIHCYNLSSENSTMQGRYELLKVEMERNPVDSVVIDLSFNSLTKSRDEIGYEGDFYVLAKLDFLHRIPYFFEAVQPSEYFSLYYEFLNEGFKCWDKIIHGTWIEKNRRTDRGYVSYQHDHCEEDDEDSLTGNYVEEYNTKIAPEEIYESSLEYLDMILNLCKENNIEVTLISIPMSKEFICQYQNLDVFREWYEEIADEYGVKYYDFSLYKDNSKIFTDEENFYDVRHLNNEGADKFSKLFCSVFKQIREGEDVDELFYDSYAQLREIYKSELTEDF